jgi:hypothetical protein
MFLGKTKTRRLIPNLTDIYQLETQIAGRIAELDQTPHAELAPKARGCVTLAGRTRSGVFETGVSAFILGTRKNILLEREGV